MNPFVMGTHQFGVSDEGKLTLVERSANPFLDTTAPLLIAEALSSAAPDFKESTSADPSSRSIIVLHLQESAKELKIGVSSSTAQLIDTHVRRVIKELDPTADLDTRSYAPLLTGTVGMISALALTIYTLFLGSISYFKKPEARNTSPITIPRSLLPARRKTAAKSITVAGKRNVGLATWAKNSRAPTAYSAPRSDQSFAQRVITAYPTPRVGKTQQEAPNYRPTLRERLKGAVPQSLHNQQDPFHFPMERSEFTSIHNPFN